MTELLPLKLYPFILKDRIKLFENEAFCLRKSHFSVALILGSISIIIRGEQGLNCEEQGVWVYLNAFPSNLKRVSTFRDFLYASVDKGTHPKRGLTLQKRNHCYYRGQVLFSMG